MAVYGMFLAIIVPPARASRPVMGVCAGAVALSCLFAYAPGLKALSPSFSVVLCGVLAAAFMAWRFPQRWAEDAP